MPPLGGIGDVDVQWGLVCEVRPGRMEIGSRSGTLMYHGDWFVRLLFLSHFKDRI
jgi:hypothetical protein